MFETFLGEIPGKLEKNFMNISVWYTSTIYYSEKNAE